MPDRPIVIRSWIVFYASLMHLTWAFALVISDSVMDAVVPIREVASWLNFERWQVSLVYFLAGSLAWYAIKCHRSDIWGLALGMPQMILIFMGMSGCIDVVLTGKHPDGTVASSTFFAAQLAGSIWLAPIYMLVVYLPYWKALWKARRQ